MRLDEALQPTEFPPTPAQ